MKTIGLLGGMSWESSAEYYRIVNEEVKRRLGGTHSAKCVLYSVDFEEIERLQVQGKWKEMTEIMIKAAQALEKAGSDMIVICTNTMHKMAGDMEKKLNVPILHIADATAIAIKEKNIEKIALLGTKYTMEQEFYKNRLIEKHNLEVLIPDKDDRKVINQVIYEELVLGKILEKSKEAYKEIIKKLEKRGAEGVILGCTEIGLLIKQNDVDIPVFDTTELHALAAVELSLET